MRKLVPARLVTSLMLATALPLFAQDNVCKGEAPISEIVVESVNVFDSGGDDPPKRVYRVINSVHRPMLTRASTVRSLLTIKEGQLCRREDLEEAERRIREQAFVQDVWVDPIERDEHGERVRARVQDAWSTRVGFSFDNSGGTSDTLVKFKETNLLGRGIRLVYTDKSEEARKGRILRVLDPALGSSRWRADFKQARFDDGNLTSLRVQRPFYRIDARWSVDAGMLDNLREERVFVGSQAVDRWQVDASQAHAWYGRQPRWIQGHVTRWEIGARRDRQLWKQAVSDSAVVRPDLRPADRDLLMGGVRLSWQKPRFSRAQFVTKARRIEDIDLTREITLSVEKSLAGASKHDGATVLATYRQGFHFRDRTFVFVQTSARHERLNSRELNGELHLDLTMHRKLEERHTLALMLSASRGRRLEGPNRFDLGGDKGLRGYDAHTMSGDRRFLLTVEHRWFAPWELFDVLNVGMVGFVDVGSAWDAKRTLDSRLIRSDIGVGLRGYIKPASGDTTLHLNLSYALDEAGSMQDRLRLTVSSKTSF